MKDRQIRIISESEVKLLDGAIDIRVFPKPEEALDTGDAVCYAGNRLTAPYHGIETRDTVVAREGGFCFVTFLIDNGYGS